MKTGRNLNELATEIIRRADAKLDLLTPSRSVGVALADGPHMRVGAERTFGMLPLAHQQVVHHLGVPKNHYDYLLGHGATIPVKGLREGPGDDVGTPLWSVWVNALLAARPATERRMVRTLDGDVRAFLSDRYRPIDNEEVAEKILPILQAHDLDWQNASMEVTDTRLYIRVINPAMKVDLVARAKAAAGSQHHIYDASKLLERDTDEVVAGVQITNSEVGLGTFAITPLVFRRVCSNGLVVIEDGKRKYHTGGAGGSGSGFGDDVWTYMRDDTVKARNEATILEMRDLVEAALGPSILDRQVDKILRAAGIELESPEGAIEVVRKRYSLTDGEKDGVLAHLIRGGDLSLWGLVNATTGFAQTVESFDRSVELEQVGGEILTFNGDDLAALQRRSMN